MSIRVIASVGVMLSVAVTSFSIYLGTIEHSYSPVRTHQSSLTSLTVQRTLCLPYRTHSMILGTTKVCN
jgi:hypothetical protein